MLEFGIKTDRKYTEVKLAGAFKTSPTKQTWIFKSILEVLPKILYTSAYFLTM